MIFETLFFITLVVIICLLTMLANKINRLPYLTCLGRTGFELAPRDATDQGGARMDLYYLPPTLTLRSGL